MPLGNGRFQRRRGSKRRDPSFFKLNERGTERKREQKRYKQDLQANPGSLMLCGALFKAKFDRKLNSSNNEDKLRNRLQITRKTKLFVR